MEAGSVLSIKLSQFYYRFKLSTDNTLFIAYTWGRLSRPLSLTTPLHVVFQEVQMPLPPVPPTCQAWSCLRALAVAMPSAWSSLSSFRSWVHAFTSSRSTVDCHLSDQRIIKDTTCKDALYSVFLFPTALITTQQTV